MVSTPNLGNIYTRAWYAITGRLYNFLESAYRDIGHITPVHLWNLKRMVEDKFDLESVRVNASPVPKTRLRLPTKSHLFGQCIVVKLRRRAGEAAVGQRLWAKSRIVRADAGSETSHGSADPGAELDAGHSYASQLEPPSIR